MKIHNLLLILPALALAASAQADAFKCKAADGSVVISNAPCQSGSRTEAVAPTEVVPPEQKRQAEQERERQEKAWSDAESSRSTRTQREQEYNRRLAEDESRRQIQCVQSAQSEPDPQVRANLIAACTGGTSQPYSSTPSSYPPAAPYPASPYYGTPFYTTPYGMSGRFIPPHGTTACPNGDCRHPAGAAAPQNKTGSPAQGGGGSSCRQVGNSVRCF